MSDAVEPAPMLVPPPPPSAGVSALEREPRTGRAFLFAFVAASLGGLVWYGVIVATNSIWFYLAFLIGVAAALAAEKAEPVASRHLGFVAGFATAVAMAVTLYFVFRHFVVAAFPDDDFPLWLGPTATWRLFEFGLKADPIMAFCALASVMVAGVKAGTRR